MSVSPRLLWTVCLTTSVAMVVPLSLWSARARAEADRQRARAVRLAATARDVQELASNLPDWTRRPRSGANLSTRMTAAITAAGLPPTTLTSLSADNEQALPTSGATAGRAGSGAAATVRRSRATVVLGPITLPQLGTLAQIWRERDPAWTMSSIEITPSLNGAMNAQLAQTGGDMPLRVVVVLESLSIASPELLN